MWQWKGFTNVLEGGWEWSKSSRWQPFISPNTYIHTPSFAYHATWLSKSVACLRLKHVTRPGMPSSYQNKQQMSIPVTPKPATPQIHLVHAQTQDKGRCLNIEWCLKWQQLQLQLPPLFIQCVNVRFTFSIYILACTHKVSVLHQALTRPSPPWLGCTLQTLDTIQTTPNRSTLKPDTMLLHCLQSWNGLYMTTEVH